MSENYEDIRVAATAKGLDVRDIWKLQDNLYLIKAPFTRNKLGLYFFDTEAEKIARISWHGVSIGEIAISASGKKISAVCIYPPKTQESDPASVVSYKTEQIHSDLLRYCRSRVEDTADSGIYGSRELPPTHILKSIGYNGENFTYEIA
jgi:hypothetical protein